MKSLRISSAFLLILFLISCAKVPITGRKQMNMLPESSLMSMSITNYQSFLNEHQVVPKSDPQAQMVENVGAKLATATESFLKQKGRYKRVEDFEWRFNLVQNNTANAWCMPGGKIVFYTGILPITQNETGMAVVMSHEIAHAVARHGNERMSQQLLVQLGGIGLAVAMRDKPEQTQNIFMAAYGLGSTIGVTLPYSRLHESEADKMGLVFMAKAGYNPEKAIDFWQRMADQGGAKPPEFLSTHPHEENRIKEIRKFLPEAMKYYRGEK